MPPSSPAPTPMIVIWDPFVRIFHWTLVVGFLAAYFTEDDLLSIHVWAGYLVGGLVVLRTVWGFAGPRHARFIDFIYPPTTVIRYMVDLVRRQARRYLGHSPAGGAMVIALLIAVTATVWSGLETYAVEKNSGPLASAAAVVPLTDATRAEDRKDYGTEGETNRSRGARFWSEVHELLAHLSLLLVILHICGVVLASIVHRENLARAMVTGLKRPN